jgi:glycerol-3-phosphate dehydrogenase
MVRSDTANAGFNMKRISLEELAERCFDVVVVGAGINGSGVVQQLASQGYHVLIVDKGDFSHGASSRSSRILHCGLRHLTPGKSAWDFVWHPHRFWVACNNAKKSMQSQSQIAKTMKPLVRSFPFFLPIYRDGPYAPWQVDVAFKLLRLLGPGDLPLNYLRYTKRSLNDSPFSRWVRNPEKLVGMAVFNDYQFLSVERMVVDTLKDAHRLGGVVRNYTECQFASRQGNQWELTLSDTIDPSESATIRTRMVVNTGGPWADRVTSQLTGSPSQRLVGLKGIHLLVRLPDELAGAGIMTINRENEPMYCLPWKDWHYIGPTRTPYQGNLDEVVATDVEVDWVLSEISHAMPQLRLTRDDVKYTWAGIQPVTSDVNDPKGTREIKIHDLSSQGFPNMLMLTGGPIMTYRIIGQQLAEEVFKRIAPTGKAQEPSYYPSEVTQQMALETKGFSTDEISSATLNQIVETEQPSNLTDLLFRRSDLGWNDDHSGSRVESSAEIMAQAIGWDDARKQNEIRRFHDYVAHAFPQCAPRNPTPVPNR